MNEEQGFLDAIATNPDDATARLVYADWLEDRGGDVLPHVIRAQVQHGLPFAPVAVRDVTVEQLRDDYDWREAFGQGSGGNCSPKADACPPGAPVDLTPPAVEDVAEVVAAVNGENDVSHWVGLFRLKDGRFALVDAWCDYTGWDCQADNNVEVATTVADAVLVGMGAEDLRRLWSAPA